MPISPADIAALYKKIDSEIEFHQQKIKELTAERAGVALVEKRVQQDNAEQRLLFPAPTHATVGEPSVSFAEAVRRAVAEFKDQLFTVRDVENMLRAMNAPLPKNNLRTRIAVEVKDLVRKKLVILVERGSGHQPHKYRRVLETPKNERAPVIQPRAPSVQH
jgi:hypothetical protein